MRPGDGKKGREAEEAIASPPCPPSTLSLVLSLSPSIGLLGDITASEKTRMLEEGHRHPIPGKRLQHVERHKHEDVHHRIMYKNAKQNSPSVHKCGGQVGQLQSIFPSPQSLQRAMWKRALRGKGWMKEGWGQGPRKGGLDFGL